MSQPLDWSDSLGRGERPRNAAQHCPSSASSSATAQHESAGAEWEDAGAPAKLETILGKPYVHREISELYRHCALP